MKRIKLFNQFINEGKLSPIKPSFSGTKVPLSILKSSVYKNLKMGDAPANDQMNKALLDDIETAARMAKVRVLVTSAISDHNIHKSYSRHTSGLAVDLARLGDESVQFDQLQGANGADGSNKNKNPKFVDAGNRLVDALVSMGYGLMTEDPELRRKYSSNIVNGEGGSSRVAIWRFDDSKSSSKRKAGNHYNHIHVSSQEDLASVADPSTIKTDLASKENKEKIKDVVKTSTSVEKQRSDLSKLLFGHQFGGTGPGSDVPKDLFAQNVFGKLIKTLGGDDTLYNTGSSGV
jgi:hypothetical protein